MANKGILISDSERNKLITALRKQSRIAVSSRNDCAELELWFGKKGYKTVSESSLMRLHGLMKDNPLQSLVTLNKVAQAAGYRDYETFLQLYSGPEDHLPEVKTLAEVCTGLAGEWQLCLQKISWKGFYDDSQHQDYRFIWKQPNGDYRRFQEGAFFKPEQLNDLIKQAQAQGWWPHQV